MKQREHIILLTLLTALLFLGLFTVTTALPAPPDFMSPASLERSTVLSTILPFGLAIPPPARRVLKSILLIVTLSYAGLALYLYIFQARYVYYPTTDILLTPEDVGLTYEDVFIPVDESSIHAWFVPAKHPQGYILMCHGNGGNISYRLTTLTIFHTMGFSTLIFDYRGYGRSEGSPSEQNTYEDARAAWTFLTQEKGVEPDTILLFGRSLGGAIATWLATQEKPAVLIVDSCLTSVPDMGREIYPYLPVRLLSRFQYNAKDMIGNVRCPVIVMHSEEDDIVDISHGRALYAAAPEPKEFIEIRGTHNTAVEETGDTYRKELAEAIERLYEKH